MKTLDGGKLGVVFVLVAVAVFIGFHVVGVIGYIILAVVIVLLIGVGFDALHMFDVSLIEKARNKIGKKTVKKEGRGKASWEIVDDEDDPG